MRETPTQQNIGIVGFLVHILLATFLALAIFPIANNIGPDPFHVTEAPVPPALVADVTAHVTALSAQYGIPTPHLRFVASKVAGVTTKNEVDPRTHAAQIRLGTPVQRSAFQTRPELLKAVASHEFGHAVMQARKNDFPTLLILLMYAVGLFPFLMAWPTKRGMIVAALGMGVMLSALQLSPWFTLPHHAYLTGLCTMSLVALLPCRKRASHPDARLAPHWPSSGMLTLAALLALPAFFVASWSVGQMNIERELRADVIGACATTPTAMADALRELTPGSRSWLGEAMDVFHPSLSQREELLGALEYEPRRRHVCAEIRRGTTPLTLHGRIIQ